MNLSELQRKAWTWGAYGVAGLAAWARVEGQQHYPSDVLFGYALGHFVADFLNRLLLDPESPDSTVVVAKPLAEDGFLISARYTF